MEALDGNAIAGDLQELFGHDMTAARGSCRNCGDSHMIAELRVYLRAPGAVVRCPSCGNVVMVLVTIRGETRIDMRGIGGMEPAH
ncbi:MAG: hypothetical protein JOZ98_11970 [Solirubrobacterales bacterium]|nr:hypothetical protein [Solirubrobacterales bacterium]MBV9423622.1 hypothetical protein [Solirubrobacterales bacterium]MBV9800347.1 hypothetical protein [Solirubrobacterales bacterium]